MRLFKDLGLEKLFETLLQDIQVGKDEDEYYSENSENI